MVEEGGITRGGATAPPERDKMSVFEGRTAEMCIVECEEDGKCGNCGDKGSRYVAKTDSQDEDEIAEKYKLCEHCMFHELVDNGWIVQAITGYMFV